MAGRIQGITVNRKPGECEIVPEEAEVVRRIFREYQEGYRSPRGLPAGSGGTRVNQNSASDAVSSSAYRLPGTMSFFS